MSKLAKFGLFIECHTFVMWIAMSGLAAAKGRYDIAIVASLVAAFVVMRTISKLMTTYSNALIAGLLVGYEELQNKEVNNGE